MAGYGSNVVLRGVSLHVDEAEIVSLLGANGSGKSTILNMSQWLSCGDGGAESSSTAARYAAWRLTRRSVTAWCRCPRPGISSAISRSRRTQARLHHPRRRAPRGSSSRSHTSPPRGPARPAGQHDVRRRAADGRVWPSPHESAEDPLLDEPSGGLSPRFVAEIASIMHRMKEDGVTMLLVEQNMRLALEMSDRYLILRDGHVIDAGSTTISRDRMTTSSVRSISWPECCAAPHDISCHKM